MELASNSVELDTFKTWGANSEQNVSTYILDNSETEQSPLMPEVNCPSKTTLERFTASPFSQTLGHPSSIALQGTGFGLFLMLAARLSEMDSSLTIGVVVACLGLSLLSLAGSSFLSYRDKQKLEKHNEMLAAQIANRDELINGLQEDIIPAQRRSMASLQRQIENLKNNEDEILLFRSDPEEEQVLIDLKKKLAGLPETVSKHNSEANSFDEKISDEFVDLS